MKKTKDKTKPQITQYMQYAYDIRDGNIVSCLYVKQAVNRFLSWFERDDLEFRPAEVQKAINFMHHLKHYKAPWAGKPFKLEPWQQFVIANIFGWFNRNTGRRVTRKVLLFIARKNGKSIFAAAICLYLLLTEGNYNQVLNVANSAKQASILFGMECDLLRTVDPKLSLFRVTRDKITFNATNSFSQVMASDANGLDGWGGNFVCDESHEYKDSQLWDVLISGQGAIENPLAIQITTAGFRLDGFLYTYTQLAKDILAGNKIDDSQFTMIYTLDEDDDWQDSKVWIKANPNLGVSVFEDFLKDQIQSAINSPSLEVGVKTKNLNLFCQSSDVWLSDDLIKQHMQLIDLEDIARLSYGNVGYGGLDLASTNDISAFAYAVEYNEKVHISIRYFLPEDTVKNSVNSSLYKQWAKQGYLTVTPGNVCDYHYILNEMVKTNNILPFCDIGYDQWNAQLLVIEAQENSLPMTVFPQSIGNFSIYTKQFEIFLKQDKIVLEYNPITQWCFKNAILKFDMNENCKPIKSAIDNKIDGVIAAIEAFGMWCIHTGVINNEILFLNN